MGFSLFSKKDFFVTTCILGFIIFFFISYFINFIPVFILIVLIFMLLIRLEDSNSNNITLEQYNEMESFKYPKDTIESYFCKI